MKPKDLKFPFSWEERTVLIHDRVLFVPDRVEQPSFVFPGWDHPDLFANSNPIHVEYCSGNGAWIVEKAQSNPQINWVAVEKKFERVRKIWSKTKNRGINNLFIICGEGVGMTQKYFPSASVEAISINFPDPWPKKRHAKNRIIKPRFVEELWRILKEDGQLTMVTDDQDYSCEMIEVMSGVAGFISLYPEQNYISHIEGYGTSYFDQLWREKGKQIRYHQYQKRKA